MQSIAGIFKLDDSLVLPEMDPRFCVAFQFLGLLYFSEESYFWFRYINISCSSPAHDQTLTSD